MKQNELNLNNKYPWIDHIDWNVDKENDGTPIHICWFKIPYISLASNCSYFHFSSDEEFNTWITRIRLITKEDIDKKNIVAENYGIQNSMEGQNLELWIYKNRCLIVKDCIKLLECDGFNSKLIVRSLLQTIINEEIYCSR